MILTDIFWKDLDPEIILHIMLFNIKWLIERKTSRSFAEPTIWREQTNRHGDWYFGLTRTREISKKIRSKTDYSNIPAVSKSTPHSNVYPAPWSFDAALDESDVKSSDTNDGDKLHNSQMYTT